ncbi:hypothetical protein PT974_02162 [Cladobotryum mycophilum]|uniref:Uncharacterized protein n=1 Tax=Cladobotryum mycophilum TaxID=491253 RepID=A0ABR0SXD2_9HYPO
MSTGGITDEAAIEGHDLIHNAEVEEQKAHGTHAMTQPDYGDEGLVHSQRQLASNHSNHSSPNNSSTTTSLPWTRSRRRCI